jgi:hypothetical protein
MIVPNPFRFLAAMWRIVCAMFRGKTVVLPDDTVEEREATCSTCPFLDGGWCTQCTCWIELKAQLRTEDCPKGYWRKPPKHL